MGRLFFEAFHGVAWHVLVRFGQWEEVVARAVPSDSDVHASSVATAHYARGVAFAALGRLPEACAELALFEHCLENPHLASRVLHNNAVYDRALVLAGKHGGVLHVAEAVLRGEIAFAEADFEAAFAHLREAVARDDALKYDEVLTDDLKKLRQPETILPHPSPANIKAVGLDDASATCVGRTVGACRWRRPRPRGRFCVPHRPSNVRALVWACVSIRPPTLVFPSTDIRKTFGPSPVLKRPWWRWERPIPLWRTPPRPRVPLLFRASPTLAFVPSHSVVFKPRCPYETI
jgi:hypothetical protein